MASASTVDGRLSPALLFMQLPPFVKRHASTLLNVGLFVVLAVLLVGDVATKWQKGRFDYVEASFAIQSTLALAFILLRRPAQAVDPDVRHQLIALVAFCSAAWFSTEPRTESVSLLVAARVVMVIANVLGLATIINLGKSFGILIALRKVETRWLYSIIRHPMYLTDLLVRVGLVLQVPIAVNIILALVSGALYVQRALFEEEFLSKSAEYAAYMKRVRYRFIPFVF